jgi:acyl-coenzyme A synthetase/AMP-(fatty) acid ligase
MQTNALIHMLEQYPADTIAMVYGERPYSLGEILQESKRLAEGLRQLGVKSGDTAAVAIKPDPEFLHVVFASLQIGLRLAVIDPEMGRDNYRAKLAQLQPKWAFVDSRLLLLQEHPIIRILYFWLSKKPVYFPYSPKIKRIANGPWLPLLQSHKRLKQLYKSADNTINTEPIPAHWPEFFITYTSGTTGEPKGVVHSTEALYNSMNAVASMLTKGADTRIATHLPHFVLIGAMVGMEVHLWDQHWSAQRKVAYIEQNNITTLFGPPSEYMPLIQYCEQNNRSLPACLQHLLFGSAPVYPSFLNRVIASVSDTTKLTCLYGMTENLMVCTVDGRIKAAAIDVEGDLVGKPFDRVEVQIAEDGEVLVRSSQLFVRYEHLPNRPDWHLTGDFGHLTDQNQLVLIGRKKDMIIRGNFNLYPGLYETSINRYPGVTECAFVGVYDPVKEDEVVGLFVETNAELNERQFRNALTMGQYSIDTQAMPDHIYFEPLPRAGRQSKVNKEALRQRYKQHLNL